MATEQGCSTPTIEIQKSDDLLEQARKLLSRHLRPQCSAFLDQPLASIGKSSARAASAPSRPLKKALAVGG